MAHVLNVQDAFETTHGLPRAQWKLLHQRVCEATGLESPRHEDWCKVQRYWLKLMARSAGASFGTIESDQFMLMAPSPDDKHWMLDLVEEAQQKIIDSLGERPPPGSTTIGKTAILVFNERHLYQQHVLHYDDMPGASDGVCITQDGHTHVALSAMSGIRTVVPHELVHVHVAALPLPTWLNEGVAQIVARRWKYDFTAQVESLVRLFWRKRGVARLWSGEAFYAPRNGEEMMCAYIFSESLVKLIRGLGEAEFRKFLHTADVKDAGEEACRDTYGFGLQVWVEKLIGPGDWAPALASPPDGNPT